MPQIKPPSPLSRPLIKQDIYIDAADFVAAATAENITLLTLPAGQIAILSAEARVIVPFADTETTITACSIEIGTTANPDLVIDGFDAFGAAGTGSNSGDGTNYIPGGTALIARATATGGNLGDGTDPALDAGQVHVSLVYIECD